MNSTELAFATLTDIAAAYRQRRLSPVEVTSAMIARVEALDGEYHAFKVVIADRAMEQAHKAEKEFGLGIDRGPMHGIPVGIKDLCRTTWAPTAAGTTMLDNAVPDYNATVVERLEAAGSIALGKLKMTEAAYTSHHPNDQAPLNPWDKGYWVGSSSSGSGVATSAGMCYASIGSDTGGSIRFPSATCGLSGIKPTWGRVSRYGCYALADSLDHIGPMARTVLDAAAMLGAIAGFDPKDPTTLVDQVPDYLMHAGTGISGVRIGVDRRYAEEGVHPEVVTALHEAEKVLRDLGCEIVEVRFPEYKELVRHWIPACGVETAIAHADTYPARNEEYGPDLAQLIDEGRSLDAMSLGRIYQLRMAFCGALKAMFKGIDLLLIPTMPVPIPSLAQMSDYGEDPTVLEGILRYTAPFDFSGSPTVTMPNGIDSAGMPLSFQLVGRHVSEDLLVRAGAAFQRVTDWHTRRPSPLA